MHSFRLNFKRLSLWILLFLQVLMVTSYFYFQADQKSTNRPSQSVTFLKPNKNDTDITKITYHTKDNEVILKTVHTRDSYVDFNTSLCYTNGTDLKSMQRLNNVNWNCMCLPGWHGNDCGQPEVIWRAFMAHRKSVPKVPRKYERRMIYIIEVNEFSEILTDIRVNELKNCVDLFVLYEINSNYLENKLKSRFLKNHHHKILYVNIDDIKSLWPIVKNVIINIKDDDIILINNVHEIPNNVGLQFFKFYNDWPEPISFRLRYSVYGFFWIHPSKTILRGSACTVRYLYETFNDDLVNLNSNKTLSNLSSKNFIIGDLNHFGGWFCEFCNDPAVVISYLSKKLQNNNPIVWENINKIDITYIENLIENGVYLDGKTELVRAHRFHENYFAPTYVSENNWKYDFLLVNMFSKMDYYE